MYWVNGELQHTTSLSDRSFQYGDGCFTTMLTVDGVIEHFPLHKERVDACLSALSIAPIDWSLVTSWLEEAVVQQGKAGVKLHVSRGEGGRGYSPTSVSSPNVTISVFTYPEHYHQITRDGIELGLCQKRLGLSPLLAGHKHNNRLEQIILKSELDSQGLLDGVALDIEGSIVETTMANLFWVIDGELFTPDLSLSGVSGVMRKAVLGYASENKLTVNVGRYPLEHLENADEAFICNSILGIAPVIKLRQQKFEIGTITKSLQGTLNS